MDREEILKQLEEIAGKKAKAISDKWFEMAVALRDREKDLLKKLESINQENQQPGK